MYRVSYNQFMQLLKKSGCGCAIAEIKASVEKGLISAIEVDFTIDDEGTPDEILTIDEFYIYTTTNTVLFGIPLKHENDFTIEFARTQPKQDSKRLEPEIVKLTHVDEETKTSLEFLQTRALDASEYADTREEKVQQYAEIDDAYAIVVEFIKDTTNRMNHARGRLGDLARMIEKTFGNDEDAEEITERIDEIYAILNDNKEKE